MIQATFEDGPLAGKRMALQRCCIWLRGVVDSDGTPDALDLLEDEPKPSESVYAYRLHGEPSNVIACSRGKGGNGCRVITMARYRQHSEPVVEEVLRDNAAWREWANAQRRES